MNLLIAISLIIQMLSGSLSSKDEARKILENGNYHIENGIVIIDETGGKN